MNAKNKGLRLKIRVSALITPDIDMNSRTRRVAIGIVSLTADSHGHRVGESRDTTPRKYGSVIIVVFRRSSKR